MAWTLDEHFGISDPWRVSSLIRAFLELILALCVLLCAIVSVTTTWLIKSSGFVPSVSYDVHNGSDSTHGDVKVYQELEFTDQPANRLASNWSCGNCRDPTLIICEDSSLSCSDCACTLKRSSSIENSSCTQTCSNGVLVNNTVDAFRDHTFWPVDDNSGCQKQQGSCFSSKNADSCHEASEHIGIDTTAVSYACGCQTCICTPGHASASGRALKRKFSKGFPGNSKRSCSDVAQVLADNPSLLIRKCPAEIRVGAVGQARDGPPSSFPSDTGDTECRGSFASEESLRHSSQKSFSYSRRSPLHLSTSAKVSRNLSIDSDLLAGETTPEWNGSSACHFHEMEEEGSTVYDVDYESGVMELKEVLREEQEALAALYAELEEERNASSSAAHEAMAMITRLQEEKAAIQMEARQYQRMAEEKQLYDQEALASLQEILGKREEEMYALEEEIHLYRNRLLSLETDSLTDQTGRVGSPRMGNDVLLIERETMLVDGSADWKLRSDSYDEKLLAEIKDWLRAANEKIAPERVEDLDVSSDIQKLSSKIGGLPLSNGKKNLLESFCTVAVEESRRDGVLIEDAEIRRDTAADYEMFLGMMESLRQEPSLRDEESLNTLKKIEEKFQRQSSARSATSGDELRQIWKNTLRSFECDDGENTEVRATIEPTVRNPITTDEPTSSSNRPHPELIGNDDEERSVEEKRMSVLDYVWKFEEQLHQLGKAKPLQSVKSGLSTVETAPTEPPALMIVSTDLPAKEASDCGNRKSSPTGERPNLVQTRLRELEPYTRNATTHVERNRFRGRGQASPFSGKTSGTHIARFERPPGSEETKIREDNSVVRDVFEAQQDTRKTFPEVILSRQENLDNHDVKKFISSTVNELVHEEFIDSQQTARCVEGFMIDNGDRLWTPDYIPGHTSLKLEMHGNGRMYFNRVENFTLYGEDLGICELGDVHPGDCGDSLQSIDGRACISPSSVPTGSPGSKMEDVVEQLTYQLKSLESDRQIMQHTITSWAGENGEKKLLEEIAKQLRELRGMEQTVITATDPWLSDDPVAVGPPIQGMLSFSGLRHSMQSQLSKLAHLFLGSGDLGACHGDQHADLSHLSHRSPRSNEMKYDEPVSHLRMVDFSNSCALDATSQPSSPILNVLRTQLSWPMDVKERSETAFSGWDY